MRTLLVICAALIAAFGTGLYLYTELERPAAPAPAPVAKVVPAPVTVEVFTPRARLVAGTFLANVDLGQMRIERDLVTEEMIVADEAGRAFLTGGVVAQSLPKGVPIARSSIIHPGDRGFLAAVLPAGKRAISIEISEVAGVSGLVLPGDHVDLILTYTITAEQGDFERDIRASETVVHDIRVLALDQRLQAGEQSLDKNGRPVPPPVASTATLEVTPREAEIVSLAAKLGGLSLALNSAHEAPEERALPASARAMADRATGGLDDLMGPILQSQPSGDPTREVGLSAPAQRALTMDTDVTSLLARLMEDAAKDHKLDAIPRLNKIDWVQVVRGTQSGAVQIGKAQPDEPANKQEPAAQQE